VITGEVVEDQDVSAIAFSPEGTGVLASDEGSVVQVLRRTGRSTAAIARDAILGAKANAESDFEGAAYDDGWFYLTGSHGVAKKTGKVQPSRYAVFRFRADGSAQGTGVSDVAEATLTPVLKADPTLAPHFGKPLQRRGLNIEGLAARDGTLFFALRSPNLDGHLVVLEVQADELFTSKPQPSYKLHWVHVGPGLGARAIEATADGILIVTGNAGSEPEGDFPTADDYEEGRGYSLYFWNPATGAATRLADLHNPPGKPEALSLLGETPDAFDIVLLYDSATAGAPQRFTLQKGLVTTPPATDQTP
jgi:hypothetical protein